MNTNNFETAENDYVSILFKRNERDQLLKDTDKYLLADYPISPEKLELVKEYRQKLRDYMSLDAVKNYSTINKTPFPNFPQNPINQNIYNIIN